MVRNCTPENLEIPGSVLRTAPERRRMQIMPGLVPGIHELRLGSRSKGVDGRDFDREDALRAFARP
ncbi:hypothetical protein BDS110ZK25_48390 [Bradyrhizobium diazoefficiens]|uniref:Uncharacterized protein n=1 Tax=Bradyrhizobium diazoefficiens TaxID=1355477 RepID=A0A810D556_9BRAD|nr:hypothetical protein Bdiaspc4_38865 [Bradyrhizobium diazoefficiens]BBZ98197.1 hypothetical protein F07S3_80300 [Bradyrhizobium diazoefficiens]BCA07221.1 hypothetical protein H12S4_81250 [Bradyrhizobium diazoefficiens]BCA15882.1 hypothetical protein BDHF08_77290 [Bradyrhizobium diazoefficiens]BCA24572.1 hypothetical protein BDHH15_77870 [Bradyrhizobium diazoefficiens]